MPVDRAGVRSSSGAPLARFCRWWAPAVIFLLTGPPLTTHLLAVVLGQWDQQRTFRARVDLVEVDFVATNDQGLAVVDLRKEELEVLEDGEAREVASFGLFNVPVVPPHAPYARDVHNNEQVDESRLFFLILDDVQTLRERTGSVKAVAKRFIEHLSPNDQLGVAWMSQGNAGAREFTTNHAAVMSVIDAFAARDTRVARANPLEPGLPNFVDLDDRPPTVATDLAKLNVKEVFDRSRPFRMVADISSRLASLPHRRKAIVFVGTGPMGVQLEQADGVAANPDSLDFARAMTAAWRANVTVYTLDPSARLHLDTAPLPSRNLPPRAKSLVDAAGAASGQGMAMLSLATGGTTGLGPSALGAVNGIVSDTGTYYLLGYYTDPPAGRLIDKFKSIFGLFNGFRTIEVRTTRPGVRIRARKGYWASDAGTGRTAGQSPGRSDDITATGVTGVLPVPALPLRALAAPLRSNRPRKHEIAVIVDVRLPELGPAALGMPVQEDVHLVIAAVAPGQGVQATNRARARLDLGVRPGSRVVAPHYQLRGTVTVPPGHYQIRVAVRSNLAGRTGSVYADATVPDFYHQPVSLGGLFLERRGSRNAPISFVTTKAFASLVPFEPTLERTFSADDEVWMRARVYRGSAGPHRRVTLTATVRPADDPAVTWTATEAIAEDRFGNTNEAEFRVRLPIDSLRPGTYRLGLIAETAGTTADVREVDFALERGQSR